MAESSNAGGGGLLDLEKELSCSICTDILYQPLTLLDCLHTFCGGCSKEWFAWQALSAATTGRRTTTASPYTCPSCREPVRGTKADWRLTTLLEGFLKANPDKGKAEDEKEEMCAHYKPGDEVLPPVVQQNEVDSEDERLVADVVELSMANVDPDTARRRTERAARERQRRRQEQGHGSEGLASYQQNSRRQAQRADRRTEEDEQRQVEHQPSLRSLLSNSDINSEDVQEEILQSIYSEGLLTGIDIDNLTPAQEEELTERIAEAYRRRQRHRDRSRNRDRRENNAPPQTETRRATPPAQQPQTRARPPISRPHLFEQQTVAGGERSQNHRRSSSSTSHQRSRQSGSSRSRTSSSAAQSATNLSVTSQPASRPRAVSSNARSSTDPVRMRDDVRRVRATSNTLRPETAEVASHPRSRDTQSAEPVRRQTAPTDIQSPPAIEVISTPRTASPPQQQPELRLSTSMGALAPVPVSTESAQLPSITCSRCQKSNIATQLHYNCSKCDSGSFNLCLRCYREGKGCHNWYGFGTTAWSRWQRTFEQDHNQYQQPAEYPHVLAARRYTVPSSSSTTSTLEEGPFCEICQTYTPSCYWSCPLCLSGAWGYCNCCVLRGKHCTHPLLPTAHISSLHNPAHDPTKLTFLPLPHLKPDSYLPLPILTDCDVCRLPIPSSTARYHCYECSEGDYDICPQCYTSLTSSTPTNSKLWRRCPKSHRMSIISYQPFPSLSPASASQQLYRYTHSFPIGGFRLKEDSSTMSNLSAPPADEQDGGRVLANWSFWPLTVEEGGDGHDLEFPRGAEIREVEERNEDWSVGVYCGKVGVFPTNHTRRV